MAVAPSTLPVEKVHITRTPGVCGGKPCIAGTRIRVQDIYFWYEVHGRTPEQIVEEYPQLTLADVFAALTYLWDNRDEILQEIAAGEAKLEEMKKQHPSVLAEILKQQGEDSDDPLSPR